MSFVEDIEPFEVHLSAYRQRGILPIGDNRDRLADIYEKHFETHPEWRVRKLKRNCATCITDMMKALCGSYEVESRTVVFKGVPDVKIVPPIVDLSKLSWLELKRYAKKKGVKTYKKNREQIEQEINAI